MKKPTEIFVQLVVGFAEDPEVRKLARFGKDARACRDLYVQMLCYCKRTMSDGHVPAEEIGVLVYPDAPKVGERDADRLVSVDLAERTETGYFLPGYLKRNKSRAEIEEEREGKAAGGSKGNHVKWHVMRGVTDSECDHCTDRSSDGDATPGGIASDRHRTEDIGQRTEDRPTTPSRKRSKTTPDGFDAFWIAYPKKVGKDAARKAWGNAVKRAEAADIIGGLGRLLPSLKQSEPKFIPHPASWLNAGRWEDEVAPRRAAGSGIEGWG